ncbi:MAG: bifunctional diguanylate cyclase/phosphodiesterase [Aquisalimonadaceae bacterium]
MNNRIRRLMHPTDYRYRALWYAIAVGVLYLVISIAWITFSDELLHSRFPVDPRALYLSKLKGWGFVTVMTFLIGGLVYTLLNRIARLRIAMDQSRRDVVTGTGNRLVLVDALQRAIAESARTGQDFAVIFVDVRKLNRINRSLGRAAGDEVLREIARQIRAGIRPRDVLTRLDSDKFAVIMPPQTDPAFAYGVTIALSRAFEKPVNVSGVDVPVQLAIGLVAGPADDTTEDRLLDTAEMALAQAKESGVPAMIRTDEPITMNGDTLQMEAELRAAADGGQLVIHLQPQYDIGSGALVGAEALVRWQHPARGLVLPGEFIPLAESAGFISDITRSVIEQVCALCGEWHGRNVPRIPVSVNLSVQDLSSWQTVTIIRNALRSASLPADWLSAEITESGLMENPDIALRLLDDMRSLGMTIAIDDFGTGYSSLIYLSRFRVDYLKVDRSFVTGVGQSQRDIALLRAINDMAHAMEVRTLAEGVETRADLELVQGLRFDAIQGFLVGRPLPAEEFFARHFNVDSGTWKKMRRISHPQTAAEAENAGIEHPGRA